MKSTRYFFDGGPGKSPTITPDQHLSSKVRAEKPHCGIRGIFGVARTLESMAYSRNVNRAHAALPN